MYELLGLLSDSINRYWFEGHESPVPNLTSKLAGFALTLRVNRATKMNSVWQGVSIDPTACS